MVGCYLSDEHVEDLNAFAAQAHIARSAFLRQEIIDKIINPRKQAK